MSVRVKQRRKMKDKMLKVKDSLLKIAGEIHSEDVVSSAKIEILCLEAQKLVQMQAELNAISVDVDERQLLEQSARRYDRSQEQA